MELLENYERITLERIDEILKLPNELELTYEERKRDAYVGSLGQISRRFHRLPIAENWFAYSKALKSQGAIVAIEYKLPMINTEVIPEDLVDFVLEHEATECALSVNTQSRQNPLAVKKIRELGLIGGVQVSRPKWNHAFATVRQLRLAQRRGLLNKMISFADDLELKPENKRNAIGNQVLREAIFKLLTNAE
ncbi:hypothetical protein KKG65_02630 [Patescibacteria group bacterium]|nr:hypothetical protein [Patescibacteria group bacterium]